MGMRRKKQEERVGKFKNGACYGGEEKNLKSGEAFC